jgi:hypothetical protein|tara:strand:- start:140 stop:310 length:171 start_codon:yes stop_codon:yes gene_type:complete
MEQIARLKAERRKLMKECSQLWDAKSPSPLTMEGLDYISARYARIDEIDAQLKALQ